MKSIFGKKKSLLVTAVTLVLVVSTIGFWQYQNAEAVSVKSSGDYLSIDTSLTPVSSQVVNSLNSYTTSGISEKSTNYYEIDYPGSGSKIGIGQDSKTDAFKPDLNISTWNGEADFKLIAPTSIGEKSQLTSNLKDNDITASNGEWSFEYKPTEPKDGFNDKGGLDILITAKVKPTSNRIEFTYESNTVTPYYQPPLTEEYAVGQQAAGSTISTVTATKVTNEKGKVIAERPEYVVNSIAFYANDKANYEPGKINYATGKVGHLYAMKIGNDWAGWTIDGNKIVLTIPQEILDKAQYPLTITPAGDTFGYTTVGSSIEGVETDEWEGSLFTAPASGSGTSISVYCRNWASGVTTMIKGVLVTHSNLNIVTNGITSITNTPNYSPFEWSTCNFATAPSLTASTEYVIGFIPYYYHDVKYDTGSANQGHEDTGNDFSSPTNPTSATHSTRKSSIYVTYTTGGGSPSISNTPNSYNFGEVNPNDTISTGLSYFTVTNNSGSAVNITIGGTDITGGTTWTLSDTATAGSSTVGLKAGLNGGSYNIVVKKTAPYNTLKSNLASSGTQGWGLQLLAPTNSTDSILKTGTVTLTATTP
jgi:hypothetical protein